MSDIKTIARFPSGVVELPSSKSISHRAIICAGLAPGDSIIRRLSGSDDIAATIACMTALGARIEAKQDTLMISGALPCPRGPLDCGESGTTLRLLIPLAALGTQEARFTGRGRLLSRPLDAYLQTLAAHGAACSLPDGGPLTIRDPLVFGVYSLPGDVSSQFVSGLLLALPLLPGDSEIHLTTPLQSAAYVGLTLDMMAQFGVRAEYDGGRRFAVPGGQIYRPADLTLEADYSQAAFFLAAGALGRPCELRGLSAASRQGDRQIVDLIAQIGARPERTSGGLIAYPGELHALTVDVSDIPDLVPPLAALLALADGTSRLTNAARLRHKESDRLAAISGALGALGASVAVEGDSLVITGKPQLRGGAMDSCGDHRIAMMGAVAAIRCDTPVTIAGSECVAKSYPDFWLDFEKTPG